MRLTHSSPCAKICGATTSRGFAWRRLSRQRQLARRVAPAIILIIAAAVVLGCLQRPRIRLRYALQLPTPVRPNELPVTLTLDGYRANILRLYRLCPDIQIADCRVDGRPATLDPLGATRGYWDVAADGPIREVAYTARFGMPGRHGRQGYLDDRFGLLKGGNVFLFPDVSRGAVELSLAGARTHDRDAVTSWEGRPLPFDRRDRASAMRRLAGVVVGFGRFHQFRHPGPAAAPASTFTIRIEAGSRSAAQAKELADQLSAIYDYQLATTASRRLPPYTALVAPWLDEGRTPLYSGDETAKVYAGSDGFGQGLSMRPGNKRDLELFAHRLLHAITRDEPAGSRFRATGDGWFWEAAASYYETESLRAAGVVGDLSRYRDFHYNTYLYLRGSDPALGLPIGRDHAAAPEVREFLHYIEAPLLYLCLDHRLRANSGGGRGAADVLRHLAARHDPQTSPGELRAAVAAVADPGDFFSRFVDGGELMLPPDLFARGRPAPPGRAPHEGRVLAEVNGEPITEAELRAHDQCLRCMIENDLGRPLLDRDFPALGADIRRSARARFYDRYGDLPLEYYRANGYVRVLALLKLLDQEARRRNIAVDHEDALAGYPAIRGLKRLKLRCQVAGGDWDARDFSGLRAPAAEARWAAFIDDLVARATITYR